ncbi:dTDP-glucose 4,6-dehydratase [Streptomyces sp. RPT161]|uniref:dTDP-glucose 4,6-dehydratase n=1 Tax=Streptomyces sp. RPT161 TaxID=3015993 RepID=UPI0022B8CF22|nr:dTDP-glucose 4,6-dehydratase [Streptomyces sp. RPT161]
MKPPRNEPTRILVTGGAGFIGSAYVRALLCGPQADSVTITVLDRLTYAGNQANLAAVREHPGFAFAHGDICDTELVDELAATHDHMVHFAAESHVDRSIQDATDFVRTNVLGTQTLLAAAVRRGVGRFVHVSTDEVYGSIAEGSWPETAPVQPNSPYAASKAASDLVALAYHRTHGLDVRVTRASNTYGPHQYPEKIIPRFVTSLLQGRKVPLYGDGRHVRDWLHVDDHVLGVELVRRDGRPGEVYNIGGGNELTNRELTDLLLAACDAGWEMVSHVADRKGHDLRYAVDCSKVCGELGYRPRHDFRDGLAATVSWYRDNRDWWAPSVSQGRPEAAPCGGW